MKILYFHQHFSTPNGSTGIRSFAMAQELISRGHNVTMICGSYNGGQTGLNGVFKSGKREGIVRGIQIIEFNLSYSNHDGLLKRTILFLIFALRSIGIVLTHKYDILFATTTPLTAGIPGIVARWLRCKPFIFEVRDLWPELPKEMGVITNPVVLTLMSLLERLSYHSAHRLIGLSPGIVDGIAKLGIPRKNIAMIPNGCDLDIFLKDSEPWRPKGVKADDFMAIFTGTHGIANGLDSLLDAAAVLKSRATTGIKIVLIGQGKLKPALEERALRESLDNVIFHDPVSKAELAGLMASADLGLQVLSNIPAFYYGTSPNKFFDYISAGLPVLCNYPGWLSDMITERKCGVTVEPEMPLALAKALEKLSTDRLQLRLMGENSLSLAKQDFDRRKLAAEFAEWIVI